MLLMHPAFLHHAIWTNSSCLGSSVRLSPQVRNTPQKYVNYLKYNSVGCNHVGT